MKRRLWMWMTIICILVVGVSVTKMTRDFVVSNGVETVTIVGVADAGNTSEMKKETAAGAGAGESEMAADMASAFRRAAAAAVEKADKTNAKVVAGRTDGPGADLEIGTAVEAAAEAAETVAGTVTETGIAGEDVEADIENEVGIAVAMAETEAFEGSEGEETSVEAYSSLSAAPAEVSAGDYAVATSGEEPVQMKGVSEKATDPVSETVKSPLNPVVEKEFVVMEETEAALTYTTEEFYDRFETAEKNAAKLWENASFDNYVAYTAVAEQERALWDYELNFAYGMIRSKMSDKEAEDLKILELEWLKERDKYAEKAAAKAGKKNAQNQNTEYTKALAEKTKERCYWLVTEYEDVLDREDIKVKGK